MKFPITRNELQNFNKKKEINEKEKEERYKFFNILIEDICNKLENELLNPWINKNDTKIIWKDIDFLLFWKELSNSNKCNFYQLSYDNIKNTFNRNYNHPNYHRTMEQEVKLNEYLVEFIDLLKKNFIDCDITVDPLKTYIIIDWSN